MPSGVAYNGFAHLIKPEQVETLDVLGPTIQFLTPPDNKDAPCIMRGTIPPGVSIPLHSHADPETFLMISGAVEGLVYTDNDFNWARITRGDIFHVPSSAKHAWRNQGHLPAAMIIISTSKMGSFFQELGKRVKPGTLQNSPTPDEIRRFLRTSERYGYWNATPDENARVGISVPSLE